MMSSSSQRESTERLFRTLEELVSKVKRARRWFQVPNVNKAFIRAVLKVRPVVIRSRTLLNCILRNIELLKELSSNFVRLLKLGMSEALKASEIAVKWGYREAIEWRNDISFILYWGSVVSSWPKGVRCMLNSA
ncbi:MAG: hypothetical protein QXX41_01180 [Nitrososphaerota archaeon]